MNEKRMIDFKKESDKDNTRRKEAAALDRQTGLTPEEAKKAEAAARLARQKLTEEQIEIEESHRR